MKFSCPLTILVPAPNAVPLSGLQLMPLLGIRLASREALRNFSGKKFMPDAFKTLWNSHAMLSSLVCSAGG
jgi:hypothetical protein